MHRQRSIQKEDKKIIHCGSRFSKYVNFSHFTLLFCGGRERNVLRFNMHVHCHPVKALTNEDTMFWTHCCRHKCFPVRPRAQHLLRTQILCPRHKNVSDFVQKHFVSATTFPILRSPRNIMSNSVSATVCPCLPVPLCSLKFVWRHWSTSWFANAPYYC